MGSLGWVGPFWKLLLDRQGTSSRKNINIERKLRLPPRLPPPAADSMGKCRLPQMKSAGSHVAVAERPRIDHDSSTVSWIREACASATRRPSLQPLRIYPGVVELRFLSRGQLDLSRAPRHWPRGPFGNLSTGKPSGELSLAWSCQTAQQAREVLVSNFSFIASHLAFCHTSLFHILK